MARLDARLIELQEPLQQRLAVMPTWVPQQCDNIVSLLSETPERAKAEFHQLGLRVTMQPRSTKDGHDYYQADVVNSLPCLSGITKIRANQTSAGDRSDPRADDSRTLKFTVNLPANHRGPGWRKRA